MSTTPPVSFPGLTSNIDYTSIINALVGVQKGPMNSLQKQQATNSSMVKALQDFNLKLSALNDAADSLSGADSLRLMAAASSAPDVVSATAGAGAVEGTYSLNIYQTAKSGKIITEGVADTDTASISSGAGSLQIQVGSAGPVAIDLTAGMTLSGLKDAINSSDCGVKASIVNDGTQTNPYRLILTADSTGTANQIKILHNDTTFASLSSPTTGIVEAAAANQANTFDGTVTSSGTYAGTQNKTYTVRMTTGGDVGAAKFKVSEDGGLTWSADDAFTTDTLPVSIYKGADQGVKVAFSAGTTNFAVGDTFTVDAIYPTLQNPQDAIFNIDGMNFVKGSNTVTDALPGVTLKLAAPTAGGNPAAITVTNDNEAIKQKINDFVTAYNAVASYIKSNASYDSVTKAGGVFLGDITVRNIQDALNDYIMKPVPGVTGSLSQLSNIGIEMQRDGTLKVDDSKLDDAISGNLADVVGFMSGNASGTKKGLADLLHGYLDSVTKPLTGIISARINGLNEYNSSLDKEIAVKQEQLDNYQETLKKRFSALESLIAGNTSMGSYITQISGQWSSSK